MTKSLWSSPNQFGQTKTILVRPKPFWIDQNCFGHLKGQGSSGDFAKHFSNLLHFLAFYGIMRFIDIFLETKEHWTYNNLQKVLNSISISTFPNNAHNHKIHNINNCGWGNKLLIRISRLWYAISLIKYLPHNKCATGLKFALIVDYSLRLNLYIYSSTEQTKWNWKQVRFRGKNSQGFVCIKNCLICPSKFLKNLVD